MNKGLFGILNFTPDSFFDGNKNFSAQAALSAAQKLLDSGASYVDVGAEATNPFVKPLSAAEEIVRLSEILPTLLRRFPNIISLDTYHPETLAWALQFGKPILNDVSGLHNPLMAQLAAEHGLTCIVGHLPPGANGIPARSHSFKIDDSKIVVRQLLATAQTLQRQGIRRKDIILDPNIGFGKSMRLNWQLLEFAKAVPDYKVMIGHSNKHFLGCDSQTGDPLKNGQELRFSDQANIHAAQIATNSGTAFLRVHSPEIYKNLS